MRISVANMREIAAALVVVALVWLMSSTLTSTLAETACAPAVRLAPSAIIHPPISGNPCVYGRPVSEQAGELAAFYAENF